MPPKNNLTPEQQQEVHDLTEQVIARCNPIIKQIFAYLGTVETLPIGEDKAQNRKISLEINSKVQDILRESGADMEYDVKYIFQFISMFVNDLESNVETSIDINKSILLKAALGISKKSTERTTLQQLSDAVVRSKKIIDAVQPILASEELAKQEEDLGLSTEEVA